MEILFVLRVLAVIYYDIAYLYKDTIHKPTFLRHFELKHNLFRYFNSSNKSLYT